MDNIKILEDWIFRELKIDISAYKSNQMQRRLNSFMSRNGASSAKDYVSMLDRNPQLRQKLADFITINVSEFFRNKEIFKEFEEVLKHELMIQNKRLKVWSAACSNGAEPYSVAIILNRITPGVKHTIIGTDIDSTILETAKKGEYSINDVKNVDKETLDKYFTVRDGKYLISDDIKSNVQFKKHDLIMDPYDKGFDVILCRNVVIYFTQETKDRIYRKFYDSLNSGGLLFVGATESIYRYADFGFKKISAFIYKKNS